MLSYNSSLHSSTFVCLKVFFHLNSNLLLFALFLKNILYLRMTFLVIDRHISNLNFISKLLERIIHSRMSLHLHSFPSITSFQSAYRSFHSTETALLRIQNDLLLACNQQKVSALVLLDLSAAFDTIDHQILLTRLSSTYGITGSACSLISSYLLN